MIKALRYFWKQQPIALSAFVVAVALLVFFGVRFVSGFIYFHDPAHRNQALEGWMTPRYVSMSYRVPPEIIAQVMEFGENKPKRERLKDIAKRMGITLEALEARVWEAKRLHNEEREKGRRERDAQRNADHAKHEAERAANEEQRRQDREGKAKP